MNQGPRYVRLMEESRGQKSRATVPLRAAIRDRQISGFLSSLASRMNIKQCRGKGNLSSSPESHKCVYLL
jgi:hypothetical protein